MVICVYMGVLKLEHACNIPFEEKSKGGYDKSSESMTINNKNIVAHASVEGNFCDNIHPCIPKLQGHHSKVRHRFFNEVAASSL